MRSLLTHQEVKAATPSLNSIKWWSLPLATNKIQERKKKAERNTPFEIINIRYSKEFYKIFSCRKKRFVNSIKFKQNYNFRYW